MKWIPLSDRGKAAMESTRPNPAGAGGARRPNYGISFAELGVINVLQFLVCHGAAAPCEPPVAAFDDLGVKASLVPGLSWSKCCQERSAPFANLRTVA